jgi:hypothetical protein
MQDILKWIIIGVVIVGLVFLILAIVKTTKVENAKSLESKGIFTSCKSHSDCNMGFVCEIRNHPTVGLCVIAPGGACHGNGLNDICYSGYDCDKKEGRCLKNES